MIIAFLCFWEIIIGNITTIRFTFSWSCLNTGSTCHTAARPLSPWCECLKKGLKCCLILLTIIKFNLRQIDENQKVELVLCTRIIKNQQKFLFWNRLQEGFCSPEHMNSLQLFVSERSSLETPSQFCLHIRVLVFWQKLPVRLQSDHWLHNENAVKKF